MGVVGSIFEPQPQSFGKIDTFRRSKNYIIIIFGNFHHYKSCKKWTKVQVWRSFCSKWFFGFLRLRLRGQPSMFYFFVVVVVLPFRWKCLYCLNILCNSSVNQNFFHILDIWCLKFFIPLIFISWIFYILNFFLKFLIT